MLLSVLILSANNQSANGLTSLLDAYARNGNFAVVDTKFVRGKGSSTGRIYELCVATFDFSGMMIEFRTWNYDGDLLGAECKGMPLCVGEPLSCHFLPKLDVLMLLMLVR